MTTEKQYLIDMYASETKATVLAVDDHRVILDRTVFYAESGGQIGDTGTIDGLRVVDTQKQMSAETRMLSHEDFPSINVGMDVVHIMEQEASGLTPGSMVKLQIDWDRRYAIMRLHSAAHVVWHFVEQTAGNLPIKGCLIGPEKSRVDFGAKIDPEMVPELERLSNAFIEERHAIQNRPLEGEPEALFWICERITMPCGGTHVRNTSEIGPIRLKRRSQGKKLDRIYISLAE